MIWVIVKYKTPEITNKKRIKTVITLVFRFQENLNLLHLTIGSKRNAVISARIIGIEMGNTKVINKIASKASKASMRTFFVSHLGNEYTSFQLFL